MTGRAGALGCGVVLMVMLVFVFVLALVVALMRKTLVARPLVSLQTSLLAVWVVSLTGVETSLHGRAAGFVALTLHVL
jgi:hypothetical protein